MSGDATDYPELFIAPPILDAHTAPSELKNTSRDDGDEECHKPNAGQVG